MLSVTSWFVDQLLERGSAPKRVFSIGGSDYSSRVVKWPSITRTSEEIRPIRIAVDLANDDGEFNTYYANAHTINTSCQLKIGFEHGQQNLLNYSEANCGQITNISRHRVDFSGKNNKGSFVAYAFDAGFFNASDWDGVINYRYRFNVTPTNTGTISIGIGYLCDSATHWYDSEQDYVCGTFLYITSANNKVYFYLREGANGTVTQSNAPGVDFNTDIWVDQKIYINSGVHEAALYSDNFITCVQL